MASAAILVVGNEILSGSVQDANSSWIAGELTARGIDVELVVTVPDRRAVIAEWVRRLHKEHTYLFTSGGIGPTPDDLTREAIADALGVEIELHVEAEALLLQWMSRELNEYDRKMAEFPRGLRLVYTPESRVPAFVVENIVILPGVPSLLRMMFPAAASLLPRETYVCRSLRCTLFEGQVAGAMLEFEARFPDVRIGSYPQWDGERYHLDLKLETKREGIVEEALRWLRERLETLG